MRDWVRVLKREQRERFLRYDVILFESFDSFFYQISVLLVCYVQLPLTVSFTVVVSDFFGISFCFSESLCSTFTDDLLISKSAFVKIVNLRMVKFNKKVLESR